jgi:hypothetical protein
VDDHVERVGAGQVEDGEPRGEAVEDPQHHDEPAPEEHAAHTTQALLLIAVIAWLDRFHPRSITTGAGRGVRP